MTEEVQDRLDDWLATPDVWVAVIYQAFVDAVSSDPYESLTAQRWLLTQDGLDETCALAGVDVEVVMDCALRCQANGWKLDIEKRGFKWMSA